MRNRNGVLPMVVIGVIVVAFTIAAFFLLGVERVTVNVWALLFLLLSELALFGGLVGLRFAGENHSKPFLKAGVTTALSLYFVAALICMIFAGILKDNLNTFVLIELAIIAVFAIITISVFAWSRSVAQRNLADMEKVGTSEPKRGGL